MASQPHLKKVTFNATALATQVVSTSRSIEVSPQETAGEILSRLGYNDSAYDLVNPITGRPFSIGDLPFNSLTDGGSITVQLSRRNSPN